MVEKNNDRIFVCLIVAVHRPLPTQDRLIIRTFRSSPVGLLHVFTVHSSNRRDFGAAITITNAEFCLRIKTWP
jgi:hypothetical protein